MKKLITLQTFNPGKGSFGIPHHSGLPFWVVLPSIAILAILIAIAVYKYKKERNGLSKAELEENAIEELIGRKHKTKKHLPSTKHKP